MSRSFRIGVVFPQTEIGDDPGAIRDFGQTVEALGYAHLVAYDHVVGANIANRPDWNGPYTHESTFHEPMVLFAYLAAVTRSIILSTGVIILPQRQAVLFGKQAANVDVLSRGRFRAGLGIGWNAVEYEALGVPFAQRGAKLDDQIGLLRKLWTEPTFTHASLYHTVTDAGIKPLPVQRPIPIWLGGRTGPAMDRAARLGDGWLPIEKRERATETVDRFREAVAKAGRDPDRIGIENMNQLGARGTAPIRSLDDAVADAEAWRAAGATGITFDTMAMGFRDPAQHLDFLRHLAEGLRLKPQPADPTRSP